MCDVLALACELFSKASVTPDEAGTIDVLRRVLEPRGFVFEVEKTPNGTTNAWITHGRGPETFVFAGHVDVVPPGDESRWTTPPFTPSRRDGKIFARGASDMKGSVAAAAVAFAAFVDKHPDHKGRLAMLITSDEEGDALEGTVRVVDALAARGERLDWCIVGEPSCAKAFGDTLKNGRRGSLNGKMIVTGKLGHVAYPEKGVNPVHAAAGLLAELAAKTWDEGTEHFGPSTFQISNIHAGVGAVNVIPAEMTVLFNIRYNTNWTAEALIQTIEAMARQKGVPATFEWKSSARPFVTAPGRMTEILRQAVCRHTGLVPALSTSGGTSDARFISRICAETVEFGPMNATIHAVNECVGEDELTLLSRIYEETIEALLVPEAV